MEVRTEISQEPFFRLSEISSGIRDAIADKFGSRLLWIVAEVSEMNIRKGHCYLSLVEKLPGNAAPVCELKGIIWANRYEHVSEVFRKQTGMELSAGTVIMFRAAVRYDVKWGLSLVVDDIEPKYTVGLLAQERERTVARLREEGVYGSNKKLNFPKAPQRVAVISAKDSRGYEDFLNKLVNNPYGYRYEVTLFSSLLQGDKAAQEMVNRLIEIFNRMDQFDVVVIVRGGGGQIDLNCFNDFKLSRAVARFPLPVLTGIGHTANVSVVDEVAFADRITPTDAADFIVDKTIEFESYLLGMAQRIQELYLDVSVDEQSRLQHVFTQLNLLAKSYLQEETGRLEGAAKELRNLTGTRIREFEVGLISRSSELGHKVKQLLGNEQGKLKSWLRLTASLPVQQLNLAALRLDRYEASAGHLNPANILKRGFSITQINGKAVKNASEINTGDLIKTIFYEGTIESEVRGKDT
jgi:exodeoxyribonuclease VII large subunit